MILTSSVVTRPRTAFLRRWKVGRRQSSSPASQTVGLQSRQSLHSDKVLMYSIATFIVSTHFLEWFFSISIIKLIFKKFVCSCCFSLFFELRKLKTHLWALTPALSNCARLGLEGRGTTFSQTEKVGNERNKKVNNTSNQIRFQLNSNFQSPDVHSN